MDSLPLNHQRNPLSEEKYTKKPNSQLDNIDNIYVALDSEKKWSSHHRKQKSPKYSTWMQSQKWQNDLCSLTRQTIQYHSNPSPVILTSNAEEAEAEWFYEELQDLLELTPKRDVLFIIGD